MSFKLGLFAAVLVIAGCAGEGEPPPGSPVVLSDASLDAAVAEDAAVAGDADLLDSTVTSSDAGALADAAFADASEDDAAVLEDSGAADAGTATVADDAGVAEDAAMAVDAGGPVVADAGAPSGQDAGANCESTADCIAGAEICGDLTVVNNVVETHCVPPNPNGAAIGGPCNSDAQCREGICLSGLNGECSVACEDSARDCPAGFLCTGYRYNPGNVTVGLCNRSCTDNDDCAGGAPGNFCSTQVYEETPGVYAADLVCQAPPGIGVLGAACVGGNDCQSGLCLTTTRTVQCTSNAQCMGDETCMNGDCVSRLCSMICDDAADCSAAGQPLTMCDSGILLGLPDGNTVAISACARL